MTVRKLLDYLFLTIIVVAITYGIRHYGLIPKEAPVVVVDGDSLRINGNDIRLYGIDAPEHEQSCKLANGKSYRCGRQSKRFLRQLIAGKPVKCRQIDIDRYDREIAICTVGKIELNLAMVKNGWAVAYLNHSLTYAKAEAAARKAQLGIWRGIFVEPEDWRAENR